MLDERHMKLVDYMLQGITSKTELAKLIGVSRQAIYDWLSNDEVMAQLDEGLIRVQTQVAKKISSQLEPVVDELYKIALTGANARERKDACIYLINRVLGTPKGTLNLETDKDETEVDILAAMESVDGNNEE